MIKKYSVLLTVMVFLLAMSSVLVACPQPIPDFATQLIIQQNTQVHFAAIRPGIPRYIETGYGNMWNPISEVSYEVDSDYQDDYYDSVSYTWNWGDGSTSTGTEVTHTYTNTGVYFGTVTASDSNSFSLQDDPDVIERFYIKVY